MPRPRYKWNTVICRQCGTEFKASRSDAKLCSPGCRKTASREQIRRRAAEKRLGTKLEPVAQNTLKAMLKDHPDLHERMISLAVVCPAHVIEEVLLIIRHVAYARTVPPF